MLAKWASMVVVASLCWSCRGGQGGIERIIENGAEVVLNGAQPVGLKGEPSVLSLEKEFVLDTENDAVAALGVTDIFDFDVDGVGNIFVLLPPAGPRNCVYKLSPDGKLMASFGLIGQGPNEMEYPNEILANDNGEIWVLESPKNKVHVFDSGGKPVADRVTLTAPALAHAGAMIFLVTGSAKVHAVTTALAAPTATRWPAQEVMPRSGRCCWQLDQEAAGALPPGLPPAA